MIYAQCEPPNQSHHIALIRQSMMITIAIVVTFRTGFPPVIHNPHNHITKALMFHLSLDRDLPSNTRLTSYYFLHCLFTTSKKISFHLGRRVLLPVSSRNDEKEL